MVYIVRCNNPSVTNLYLDVIGKMFNCVHERVEDYNSENTEKKIEDIIIVGNSIDFIKMYRCGYRNIVYWMQGIDAEESYLIHHNIIKKCILDIITKFTLKKAKAIFFVSEEMKKFEEKKYHIDVSKKSIIMPCFNTNFGGQVTKHENKYKKNIFTYVGSLSKWQCFEETIDFYRQLEDSVDNCELKVFTPSQEEAIEILEKKGVKNYSVSFSSSEELNDKLSDVKFGFVLRENISVNQVATPTKLSTYMSAGVIPIFSECISDFFVQTKKIKYVVPVKNNNCIPERLKDFINDDICVDEINKEYLNFFDTYYNPDYYIKMYKDRLYEIMK